MKLNHVIAGPVTNSSAVTYSIFSKDTIKTVKELLESLGVKGNFSVKLVPPDSLVRAVWYSGKYLSVSQREKASTLDVINPFINKEKYEYVTDLIAEGLCGYPEGDNEIYRHKYSWTLRVLRDGEIYKGFDVLMEVFIKGEYLAK